MKLTTFDTVDSTNTYVKENIDNLTKYLRNRTIELSKLLEEKIKE